MPSFVVKKASTLLIEILPRKVSIERRRKARGQIVRDMLRKCVRFEKRGRWALLFKKMTRRYLQSNYLPRIC
jgi:hypothetical protein